MRIGIVVVLIVLLKFIVDAITKYEKEEKEKRKDEDQVIVEKDIKKHILKYRVAVTVIVIAIIGVGISGIDFRSSSSNDTGKVCQSCHKTFTDSKNTKSIARTNMCTNCYSNYKFGTKAKEESDYYKEYH